MEAIKAQDICKTDLKWNIEYLPDRCTMCGRVDDIMDFDFTPAIKEAEQRSSYDLSGQQFYFYGVCPDCQARSKTKQKIS